MTITVRANVLSLFFFRHHKSSRLVWSRWDIPCELDRLTASQKEGTRWMWKLKKKKDRVLLRNIIYGVNDNIRAHPINYVNFSFLLAREKRLKIFHIISVFSRESWKSPRDIAQKKILNNFRIFCRSSSLLSLMKVETFLVHFMTWWQWRQRAENL